VLTFIVNKSRLIKLYFVIPKNPEKILINKSHPNQSRPKTAVLDPSMENLSFMIHPVPIPTEVKMFIPQGSTAEGIEGAFTQCAVSSVTLLNILVALLVGVVEESSWAYSIPLVILHLVGAFECSEKSNMLEL
jgi:hypothetical protein